MTGRRVLGVAATALLVSLFLLGGCADSTPLWGPGSPRNGSGEPVDPHSGLPIPGAPSDGMGGASM
jgi:hypothetical protein